MSAMRRVLAVAATVCVVSGGGVRAQAPAAGDLTIVGHVLGQDGEPVRAAEVWLTAAEAPDVVVRRTRTDGEGVFLLGRLANTAVVVHARAPGMTTASVEASPLGVGAAIAVDLRLWDARTLRGRLLDGNGNAIAGASLVAVKDFALVQLAPVEGTTDKRGEFELPGVPIGDCVLRAIAPGFAFAEHAFHDWIDERVELRLQRGDGMQLRLSAEGLPADAMGNARVRLQAADGGIVVMPKSIALQRLDADGTCMVKGLPLMEWTVSMQHPEYQFASAIRVPRGADPDPLRFLALHCEPVPMSGRAMVNGRPLVWQPILFHPGPSATAPPLRTITDEEGWFEFAPRRPVGSAFQLELQSQDLVVAQDKVLGTQGRYDVGMLGRYEGVVDTTDSIELTAVRGTRMRGRVVDARGGALPFVVVEAQQGSQSMEVVKAAFRTTTTWRTFARTTSGADGSYSFGGLQPSPHPIRLRAAGSSAIGATEPFSIDNKAGERDIRTVPPGRVEGFLTDAGEPLVGAGVVLLGEQGTAVLTDYRGNFVFVGVAPGTYRLALRRGNSTAPSGDEFEVKSGEVVRIDLR